MFWLLLQRILQRIYLPTRLNNASLRRHLAGVYIFCINWGTSRFSLKFSGAVTGNKAALEVREVLSVCAIVATLSHLVHLIRKHREILQPYALVGNKSRLPPLASARFTTSVSFFTHPCLIFLTGLQTSQRSYARDLLFFTIRKILYSLPALFDSKFMTNKPKQQTKCKLCYLFKIC